MNEAEFQELVEAFTQQANKKDYVELEAFQKLLAKVFPISSLANTPEVTKNLFTALDSDRDGVLSMTEFLLVRFAHTEALLPLSTALMCYHDRQACSTMMKGDLDKKAEMWFKVFDQSKDGLLDRDEIKSLFSALYSIYGKKLDVSWLDAFLANGATSLDLNGFKKACRRVPLLSDWVTLSSRALFRSDPNTPTIFARKRDGLAPPSSSPDSIVDDFRLLKGLSAPMLFKGSASPKSPHGLANRLGSSPQL